MKIDREKLVRMLKQPSTVIGFVCLLSIVGIKLSPEMIEEIGGGALFLASVFNIFKDDK